MSKPLLLDAAGPQPPGGCQVPRAEPAASGMMQAQSLLHGCSMCKAKPAHTCRSVLSATANVSSSSILKQELCCMAA